MPIRANSIRLFVSSTFSDFRREREILDAQVFPKLQRYCADRGYQFQPVDLRWGISEEDARSQQTLKVCLNEVTRCVQTSIQPCFLALIGDRYGWQPLPQLIPEDEFRRIVDALRSNETFAQSVTGAVALLETWYWLDRNQIPPQRVLQPRKGVWARHQHRWQIVEEVIRRVLRLGATSAGLPAEAGDKYFLSATAQEIARGVFDTHAHESRPDFKQHILCFVRRRLGVPPETSLPADPVFNDVDATGKLDADAHDRLTSLISRIRATLGDNVLVYQEFVDPDGCTADYETAFARNAERLLGRLVEREVSRLEGLRDEEQEWLRHEMFGQERAERALGRADLIDRVDRFLDRSGGRGMIVHGVGGIGKSTLAAKAASMASDLDRGLFVVQRYIGATAAASASHSLLVSLLRQLAGPHLDVGLESLDLTQLGSELRRRLSEIAVTKPKGVLLALDALDQLPKGDPGRSLDWIPYPAPDGVALLVSTVDGDLLDALRRRMPGAEVVRVGRLLEVDARAILRSLLRQSDRRLQQHQEDHLLRRFRSEGSPLYLRVAAHFAQRWTAYEDQRAPTPRLPATTLELIGRFFTDLSGPGGHAPLLVSTVLGLLAAAKHGLTETELRALLWENDSYRGAVEASNSSNMLPPLRSLPMILWSRFRDDVASFLVERGADGTAVLSFFHRIFHEAVDQAYLSNPESRASFQRALIAHFQREPLFVGERHAMRPNLRKLSELPYQLIASKDARELLALLSDRDYFLAKLTARRGEEYYREVHACAVLLEPRVAPDGRATLINVLARHVVSVVSQAAHVRLFSAEELHVSLIYLDETGIIYRPFLMVCMRKLAAQRGAREAEARKVHAILGIRLANLRRRSGDIHRAKADLTRILPLLRRRRLLVEVSRAEYDLAYIDLLRGNFATAARVFLISADSARRGGSAVSESISICLAARAMWTDSLSRGTQHDEAPRFLEVLDRVEPVFQQHITLDSNAVRWITNVRLHRFKIGFRTGDLAMAQHAIDQLQEDPWMTAYGQLKAIIPALLPRIEMLKNNHADAARMLDQLIRTRPQTYESVVEDYFDAGTAYVESGQKRAARNLWRRALKIDPNNVRGNSPWKTLIRSAMASTK